MAGNLEIRSIVTDNRITASFSDKYLPRYARHGELYVVDGILYIFMTIDGGNQGRWLPLTNEKEIFTYEKEEAANVWTIPIDFHTDNVQVIVYDSDDEIYNEEFDINIDSMEITVTFSEEVSGQAYIIYNQAFDWVNDRFIVGDKNFAVIKNNDQYNIEVDTEFIEILRNGNTTFRQNVTVEGSFDVTGSSTMSGDQTLSGNVNIGQNLQVGGSVTVINDISIKSNAHFESDIKVDGNAVIDGNLTVKGTTTSIQTEEIKLDDNIITLNANAVGTPTQNAGIEVERGDATNITIVQWDETLQSVNVPNDFNVSGNLQIDGDTNLNGNLSIRGEEVDIATTTLTVADNIVTINKGFVGTPTENVGLEVDRGDEGILPIITFEESNDYVTIPVKQQDGSFLQDEVAGKIYTLDEINKETNRSITIETVLDNRIATLEATVSDDATDIQSQVDVERAARISGDENLTTVIDGEIVRATNSENALRTDIITETSERETTDVTLQSQITAEVSTRINDDIVLQAAINTERSRAQNSENTLQTAINTETIRAQNSEGDLTQLSTIDKTSLVNALNEEIVRAKTKENDVTNDLVSEENNRISGDANLQTNIDSEVSNRSAADVVLQSNLDSEISNRTLADNTLQSNITAEQQRATGAEAILFTKFGQYISNTTTDPQEIDSTLTLNEDVIIKKNLSVEGITTTVNATSTEVDDNKLILNSNVISGTPALDASVIIRRGDDGEQNIIKWNENGTASEVQISEWDTDILQYVDRKIATVPYVDSTISTINTSLDGRISTLESDNRVDVLITGLSNEVNRAQSVEGDLTQLDTTIKTDLVNAINSEISRAISAETTTADGLTDEINRSVSKDAEIELNLNNEVSRSTAKDVEIELNLSNEVNRAEGIEGDLTTLTTVNKTSLTGAINSLKNVVDINNATHTNTLSAMFTKTGQDIIFKGNLVPETDSALNIGSLDKKIGEVYVSANTIYLGDNTIINEMGLQLSGYLNTSSLTATTVTADNIYDKTTVDTILTGVEGELNAAITALETAHNTLVDTVANDTVSKTVTENQSVTSDMSFLGSVTFQGSINVIGTQTNNNVINLNIENNEILMNYGMSDINPYLDGTLSIDRGNKGIQPILTWKELGDNSAVMVPYIDEEGNIIQDEVVTSDTLSSTVSTLNDALSLNINDEISRATDAESLLDTKLTDEISRAKSIEGVLSGLSTKLQSGGLLPTTLVSAINKEVSRAFIAESNLTTALNNEVATSLLKFSDLESDIDSEVARATNKESSIESALTIESDRAKAAESVLNNALTAEKTRSQLKENDIALDLTSEVNRASSTELSLQNQIDTIVSTMSTDIERLTAIQNVTSAFENADSNLNDAITTLSNEATTNLNDEIARSTNAETILTTNLSNEIARAKDVEGQLIALDTVDQTDLVSAINEVHTDVDDESVRSIAAEGVLTTNLSSEIARATLSEATLQSNIDSEETTRIASDTVLQNNIDTEEGERIASDNTLQSNIDVEVSRATIAEGVLTTNLSSEVTRASNAETLLTTNLTIESNRASTSESTLQTNINIEEAARISSDNTLQTNINTERARIDSILLASEADKDSFAEIVTLINSIDTQNDTAFATYVASNDARSTALETNLNNEITRATNSELTLQSNINTEATSRIASDNILQTNIDNEETRATTSETLLSNRITDLETSTSGTSGTLQNDLDNEVARATAAESTLQANIDVETGRINSILFASSTDIDSFKEVVDLINTVDTENDNAFAGYVSTNDARSTTIESYASTEHIRATGAESTLQANIDIEESARINADNTLQSNINAEVSRATSSENTISTGLSNETSRAIAAELTLQANIDNEESARTTSDNNLQLNINVEKARIDAILNSSTADKDSFAEIVTLVNSIDTGNDSSFASYVLSNDAVVANIVDGTTPVENANKLTNARTISLIGDVTGAISFDGSESVSITTIIGDDSHNHIIGNIDGLQTALDGKQPIGVYNTIIGTDTDLSTSDATVVNSITVTDGVITSMDTRTMTLAHLGFVGDNDANNYIHPTVSGDKHIPTGGTSDQILRWTEDGTAEWSDEVNTWRGISDSINTNSSTVSASLTAIKTVYDLANHSHPYANLGGDNSINFNGKTITASVAVNAPKFVDSDNIGFYADFSSVGTSINVAGDIVAAGDVTAYSDRRLKTNVELIPNAMEKVSQLNGVTFNRTDLGDAEKRHTGVIAQEVEAVLPEAVSTDEDGMKKVSYGNMVGLLIEGMKEQQQQINDLKNEIKILKGN